MKYFLIIISFFISGFISAQDVTIKAFANTESVALGEYIKYTVESNTRGEFKIPEFTNFKILRGGGISSNNSINIVNGKMTQTSSYSTTYLIEPTKKGTLTIQPASINVKGKSYKSNTLTIYVDSKKPATKLDGNAESFARIKLNKSTVYVGEPVVATYYMYSVYRPQDASLQPTYKDFWSEKLSDELKLNQERINGKVYYELECQKVVLFPQKSGQLKITPFEGIVQVMKGRRGGFFSVPQLENITLNSNSPTLNVLPLPGSESNFVGKYTAYLSVSKTRTTVNEGFDVKITLKGTGNLKRINDLNLNFPPDFEVYDPEITEKLSITPKGYKGEKTFNYLVIPRAEGSFDIPSYKLSFFNSKSKTFETQETPGFTIEVEKGDLSQRNLQTHQNNKQNVELLDNDIRYIKTESNWLPNKPFYSKWWFWASIILPILMLLYLFFFKQVIDSKTNTVDTYKLVKQNLNEAKTALSENNETLFLEKSLNAWQFFLCYKLNLDLSQFNKQNISSKLKNHSKLEQILSIINQLEMAKYAPIDPQGKEDVLTQSESLINQLNNEI